MRQKNWIAVSLVVFWALFIGQIHPAQESISVDLYHIAKSPRLDSLLMINPAIIPRQELQNSLIVAAPAAVAGKWQEQGLVFTRLDENAGNKTYYLVKVPQSSGPALMGKTAQLIPIEDSIFLYAGDPLQLQSLLAGQYSLVALPDHCSYSAPASGLPPISTIRGAADEISLMAKMVSKDNLEAIIQALQDFQTRYALTSNCQASANYIYDYFTRLGIEARIEPFTFLSSYSSQNVVATTPGQTAADNVVILCAHYDSYSTQPYILAPGADDNASGSAAVMEAARILRQYPFDFTIRYILFSAEEEGLHGSAAYAEKAAAAGEKIVAVINLDMIAYTHNPAEDLDLIVNPASEWLADLFITASQRYAAMPLKKVVNASDIWSDHASFWSQGYPALCGIEEEDPPNPNYHTPGDTLATLNLDFATLSAKAALAAAADIAQPVSHPRPPSSLTARSQTMSSLFSSSKTVYIEWQPSSDPVVQYNVYRSSSLASGFQKVYSLTAGELKFTDRFLDPATAYFYAVSAVDDQNRESNFSQVVKDNANNSN